MKPAKAVVLFAVVLVSVVVSAQVGSHRTLITQAIDESKLAVLRGNTHPMARAQYDRGPAPASLAVQRMMLVLKTTPEQGAALDQLLAEQQDRSSANYHRWLTPAEFGERFGASDADVQKVTAWLTSHGFTVDMVAKGHNVLEFSGNAAQTQSAFHTAIHSYQMNGKQYWANANDPAIPAALTPAVAGIASLNNFPRSPANRFAGTFTRDMKTGKLKPKAAANPEFTYAGGCQGASGSECYAVAPYDFATIYNILPLWNPPTGTTKIDGTGQTIAIVSNSDINTADFTNFRSLFGLPPGTLNRIYTPGSSSSNPGVLATGNESEADVDTQWAGAVAPGATIDLVISADNPSSTLSTFGGDISAVYVIDGNVSPMPSVLGYSYGACEFFLGVAGNQLYGGSPVAKDSVGEWAQAAAEGLAVVVSTGDNGSTACESPSAPAGSLPSDQPAIFGVAVSGIASTPYNVAVGGTDFDDGPTSAAQSFWNSTNAATTQASVKGYIPEVAYNDSCVNVPLDLLFDTSASQDAEINCNMFASSTSNLGPLVVPFGAGGGVSSCINSNITYNTNGTPSGGSFSSCTQGYSVPTWQQKLSPAPTARELPDVAIFAGDGTFQNFYVYCQQDADPSGAACSLSAGTTAAPFPDIQGVGGTSVSAETFVGMMALLNQKIGKSVGLPNANLYALAAQSSLNCQSSGTITNSACIFYQVTSGSIAMPCVNQSNAPITGTAPGCTIQHSGDSIGITETGGTLSYSATAGYNMATGLGSLNVYNLVNEWNLGSSSSPDFEISANPAAVNISAPGGSGTTTLTITALHGFSDSVTFSSTACSGLPSGATCSFSTNPVSAGGTTILTIQTSASGTAPPSIHPSRFVGWRAPGVLAIGALLALSIVWAFRGKNRRWGLAFGSCVFLVFVGIAGCGGGSGGGGGNQQQVATPTFSPAAGTYGSGQTVTISDSTSGATVFYTTNGSTPTTSSTQYSGPISVNTTETITAVAVATGMTNSAVVTATYTINASQVATPTFSPAPGTYTGSQSVTISDSTSGATIYYTTNGTTPTTSSTKYTGPISVTSTETIEAIAVASGMTNSAVATGSYTINGTPTAITITGTDMTTNVSHSTTVMLTIQ